MSVLIERLLHAVEAYSMLVPHIQSVILVGSYARGTNHAGSDVDLVLITTDKPGMLKEQGFVPYFGEVLQTQIEYYGACTSIRAWYKNGLEIEFGIVEPSWIAKLLDAGTLRVLRDGYQVIVDKCHSFEDLKL